MKEAVTISDLLIVCSNHKDLNLTYKINRNTLNDETKMIIVQIKLHRKDKAQHEILNKINGNVEKKILKEITL